MPQTFLLSRTQHPHPPPASNISLRHAWNKEWSLCKKSVITHDFLHSVTLQKPLVSLYKPFLICKVISGHTPLNYHLHRIGKAQSPMCSFKQRNQLGTSFSTALTTTSTDQLLNQQFYRTPRSGRPLFHL